MIAHETRIIYPYTIAISNYQVFTFLNLKIAIIHLCHVLIRYPVYKLYEYFFEFTRFSLFEIIYSLILVNKYIAQKYNMTKMTLRRGLLILLTKYKCLESTYDTDLYEILSARHAKYYCANDQKENVVSVLVWLVSIRR